MKILLAAPDRDLLKCYKKLLENDVGETVTAFDGTQVLALLSAETFDIVILDRDIPRVKYKTMITRIKQKQIPVIVLTTAPVGARQLTEEPLPNAYLSYPFTENRLLSVLRDTLEKTLSDERLSVGGLEIDVSRFRIVDGSDLTAGEIHVLQSLLKGDPVTTDDAAKIHALNDKFAKTGSLAKIKYRTMKGYELVNENE